MEKLIKDKKLMVIIALVFIILGLISFIIFQPEKKNISTNLYDVKAKSNDNFVFLGDSITEQYPLEEYYDNMPVINSGVGGYQTTNILDNLEKMVYIYNPTKVFLLIGINDLEVRSNKEIIKNIKKIISEIKKNRPDAKIYVESIYPINNTDTEKINQNMVGKKNNKNIKKINKELKNYCEVNKNCEYINVYDSLVDQDGNLAIKYTTEGLHISNLGYIKVTKKILEYLH